MVMVMVMVMVIPGSPSELSNLVEMGARSRDLDALPHLQGPGGTQSSNKTKVRARSHRREVQASPAIPPLAL